MDVAESELPVVFQVDRQMLMRQVYMRTNMASMLLPLRFQPDATARASRNVSPNTILGNPSIAALNVCCIT